LEAYLKGIPFVVLVALVACQRDSATYTIATAGPWKEAYGAMNKNGMDLAIDEINKAGGARGHPLRLIDRDDEGDGSKAAAIAGEFVADHNVLAVVGHVNSGAMVAAARVYDGQLAAVSTTASSPDLTGTSRWVFRVISSDSVNGQDMARFAQSLGSKRAAIIYENNSYGRGLTESFRRSYRGEIVSMDPISDAEKNFEPYVAFLKARNPDVVFVAGTDGTGIAILREAKRQALAANFLGGDGWTGVVRDTAASAGAYVGAPFSAEDPRPEAQQFVRAFRTKYGRVPDGNAALGYDATMLIAKAVGEAGASRRGIRDYLAGLDESSAFKGVTGAIHFFDTGDVVGKSFVMTRVEHGALIVQRNRGS
jgi:branched-chain amino acid transport system substrate-binding protein